MNLINFCEKGYTFNQDHIDIINEAKNSCKLSVEEKDKIFSFYDELVMKINGVKNEEDVDKDEKLIYDNIDAFIKNNCQK